MAQSAALHDIAPPYQGRDREPVAHRFPERREIGIDAIEMLSSAQVPPEAGDHLVEDEQRALGRTGEGGVVSELRSGALFIEEVAHEPAIQVLNGCLYGLFGLYEYAQVFDDAEMRLVLERCVQGVDEALPLFDMGWWSRYSLGLAGIWRLPTTMTFTFSSSSSWLSFSIGPNSAYLPSVGMPTGNPPHCVDDAR